jgi:amidase
MNKRALIPAIVLCLAFCSGERSERDLRKAAFPLEEATIGELQRMMTTGARSGEEIVVLYLKRIGELDQSGPGLNSVLEINPDALATARALDRERAAKGPRGPLHGIPILIKDNIDTADKMETTAGSLALLGSKPLRDAFVVERLRRAGAVILGKTNLSEWANFRGNRSSSGWSGRGGQTRNPYALDRNPSGSSSGSAVAVAASLAAAAVGTETDGSIVSPSSYCGIVGLKPTVGLVSRAGIIPIAHSQDTAGPMARTVADAALLLYALAGPDPRDPATGESAAKMPRGDYAAFLDAGGLRGARIGIVRSDSFGLSRKLDPVLAGAIEAMKRGGAEIIDPVEIPTLGKTDDSELEVLLYEFKADLAAYLAGRPDAGIRGVADLIAFDKRNPGREMSYFGQEILEKAARKGPLTDKAYGEALKKNRELMRTKGIDAAVSANRLDALVAITGGPAHPIDLVNGDGNTGSSSSPAAVAGYPSITVPAGFVNELPVGISFFAGAWSEPTLIRLAYAYEQATKVRRPPRFRPSADIPAGAFRRADVARTAGSR